MAGTGPGTTNKGNTSNNRNFPRPGDGKGQQQGKTDGRSNPKWPDPHLVTSSFIADGQRSNIYLSNQQLSTFKGTIPPPPVKLHTVLSDDLVQTPSRTFGVKAPITSWSSMNTIPSEIAVYAIDSAVWVDTKAVDMERHNRDEQLDRFQRALVCLNGDISQKIFGAHELPYLVTTNTERTFNEIVPQLEIELKKYGNVDFHGEVAQSMVTVFKYLVRARNMKRIKTVLTLITTSVGNRNPELSALWMEALEEIIDVMSPRDALAKIVPIIQEKVDKNNTSLSKRAGCVLIRKLAERVHDSNVPQMAIPILQTLVKDPDNGVRCSACVIIPDLMKTFTSNPQGLEQYVHLLTQLAEDQDGSVKTCVVDAIGRILVSEVLHKNSPLCQTCIGMLKKLVKEAFYQKPPNVPLLVHFSKYIASIAKGSNEILSNDDKYWFVDAFIQLSHYDVPSKWTSLSQELPAGFASYRNKLNVERRPSLSNTLLGTPPHEFPAPVSSTGKQDSAKPEEIEKWMVRAHCAANLRNFIRFALPLVEFKNGLHMLMANLARDPNPNVRKNLAANLCTIMEDIGDASSILKDEVIKVLSDDNVDVIEAVIPTLAKILKLFVKTKVVSPEIITPAMLEIAGILLFCEERLSQTRDWRVHSSLLLQLVVLPFCMPCDHVYSTFVPMLIHRLINLVQLPSRLGAAEALISFLRNCRRAHQRNDIRRKIRGFAMSRSAQDRMLYLYMSSMIMDRFSRKYFREHFFEATLHLTEDKIPNVRTKAVRLMPKMKERLKRAEDNNPLIGKFNEVFDRIQKSEKDREALIAMRQAMEEMANVEIYLKNDPDKVLSSDDKDDARKEKEENYIASLEDKMSSAPITRLSWVSDKLQGRDRFAKAAPLSTDKKNFPVAKQTDALLKELDDKSYALPSDNFAPRGGKGTEANGAKPSTNTNVKGVNSARATSAPQPSTNTAPHKFASGSISSKDASYNLPVNSTNIVPLARGGKRTESFAVTKTINLRDTDSSRTTVSGKIDNKRKTTQTIDYTTTK